MRHVSDIQADVELDWDDCEHVGVVRDGHQKHLANGLPPDAVPIDGGPSYAIGHGPEAEAFAAYAADWYLRYRYAEDEDARLHGGYAFIEASGCVLGGCDFAFCGAWERAFARLARSSVQNVPLGEWPS